MRLIRDVQVSPTLEEIGCLLVRPSFISLDRVLAHHGATTQPCHVLTCVTTKPTTQRVTPLGRIKYHSISTKLFWGFRRRTSPNGLTILEAEPEKALLDLIYLSRRTGDFITIDIDFARLNACKLAAYARRFPRTVQRAIEPLRQAQSAAYIFLFLDTPSQQPISCGQRATHAYADGHRRSQVSGPPSACCPHTGRRSCRRSPGSPLCKRQVHPHP